MSGLFINHIIHTWKNFVFCYPAKINLIFQKKNNEEIFFPNKLKKERGKKIRTYRYK